MPGKLQKWFNENIWNTSKRDWTAGDDLYDIHGSIIHSFYTFEGTGGEAVTPQTALRNPTIYSAINVRGNTIASLPINVIEETKGKKTQLTDHSAYWMLAHEPNSYMTAANFWKVIMLHVDAWGNAYAKINRDSRRNPISADILVPWEVSIEYQDGELYYVHHGDSIPSSEVLHYRFYTWDGVCGRSPIMENRSTVGMALKLDRYSSVLMGVQPPGILSTDKSLSPEQKEQNRKAWQSAKPGNVRVVDGGFKYTPIMSTADESAFAIQKRQNKTDLLGIWQMPPQFVQDLERSTFSNAEQMDLVYAKHTISPICRNIELENNMKLFRQSEKATTYTKFNMNGLLRGDLAARQAFYQTMVNSGIMSRNEARSYEDLNPYEGGSDFLVQGAMVLADQLREMMEAKLIPSVPSLNGNNLNGKHYVN